MGGDRRGYCIKLDEGNASSNMESMRVEHAGRYERAGQFRNKRLLIMPVVHAVAVDVGDS